MGLFIVNNLGTTTFESSQVEFDLISITKGDTSLGFTETPLTNIEGFECFEVTYPVLNETGPTPQRIFDLVSSNGFVSPPHIMIIGDDGGFVLADGVTTTAANGIAMSPGNSGQIGSDINPFANNILAIYDVTLCDGNGIWVDKEGGGTVEMTTDIMLYHELSHCYRIATNTLPVDGSGNVDLAQEEVNAEIDENDMRDVRGIAHRDVNSHNGGCGGGTVNCCIIASLSTESPYSKEVIKLRSVRDKTLRNSEIGDAFFNQFFYEYYAFSPEITRLLGYYPKLKEITKDSFVNPLLLSLDLLIYYSESMGNNLVEFIENQLQEKQDLGIDNILSLNFMIKEMEDSKFSTDAIKNRYGELLGFENLGEYLNQNIIERGVIKWSLFESLKIWLNAVVWISNKEENCEHKIYSAISKWTADFPISDTWNELNRLQVKKELKNLEKYIFDKFSKKMFSERLIKIISNYHSDIHEWAKS